jgi:hypothetical protein
MIIIGHGENCPFCDKSKNEEDIFISTSENDILEHMMEEHPEEVHEFLFGGSDIGI